MARAKNNIDRTVGIKQEKYAPTCAAGACPLSSKTSGVDETHRLGWRNIWDANDIPILTTSAAVIHTSYDGRPPGPQTTGIVVLTHTVEAIMTIQGAVALTNTQIPRAAAHHCVMFPAVAPEPPTHA